MTNLLDQKCISCKTITAPLNEQEVQVLYSQIPDWQIVDNMKIQKEFIFKNFKEAIDFTNKIAELAETEHHHPNILIYEYKKMRVELYTHLINGLSINDFIMAAKIDQIKL